MSHCEERSNLLPRHSNRPCGARVFERRGRFQSIFLLTLALAGALFTSCSDEPAAPPPPPASSAGASPSQVAAPAPTTPAPQPAEAKQEASELACYITAVDLEGKPLARMAPIISRTPNAFDTPMAIGGPTNEKGEGSVKAKVEGNVFVRAWDPELNYFPNNFYEILEGDDRVAKDMTIQMVPSSNFAARLIKPDGAPAANENVGLMMLHPQRGAWWPTEANANADGVVVFEKVPAGEYVLKLKITAGPMTEHPSTKLPPGGFVQLGDVRLN